MEQQDREDLALLGSTQRYLPVIGQDLQRAKYAEFHERIRALPRRPYPPASQFASLLPLPAGCLPPWRRLRHEGSHWTIPSEGADMNSTSTLRRGLAIATVVSALAAPAASAAPIEQMVPSTTNGEPSGQPAPLRVVQAGADNGFDWGDAGIGAGGLLALAAIASGAVVAIRQRPDVRHTVA